MSPTDDELTESPSTVSLSAPPPPLTEYPVEQQMWSIGEPPAASELEPRTPSTGSEEGGRENSLTSEHRQQPEDATRSGVSTVVYQWVRDAATGAGIVLVLITLLTVTAGVWPPLTAVESGSMAPHMTRGDLVVMSDNDRFAAEGADEHGVVTYRQGKKTDTTRFGEYGSVIIFDPGDGQPQIIHRAMFYVEEGENWYPKANKKYLKGHESCKAIEHCPAPNSGYITKGDANDHYDQVLRTTKPVRPDQVIGTANHKIPHIGYLRVIGS